MAAKAKMSVIETRMIGVDELNEYYKNPNTGDINAIARSLHENGQFKPIVVNVGTKTGRPMEILAGNHTWKAAKTELRYRITRGGKRVNKTKLPWKQILASMVDVDEDTATKIVISDNETARLGEIDNAVMVDLLSSLEGDYAGTGMADLDINSLLEAANADADKVLGELAEQEATGKAAERAAKASKTFDGAPLGEEDDYDLDDDSEAADAGSITTNQNITDADEEIPGMMQLKQPDDIEFDGIGYWGVPRLLPDMLMTADDLPVDLRSWAGSATKGEGDDDTWWLYNYGVDSTSGMKQPWSQIILGFYTHDDYFENWWHYPERYVAKILNGGVKYAVCPNYSQWPTQPHAMNLWSLFRSRWIGRYLQEVGIKVIPDLNWPMGDDDFRKKHVVATLPKNLPLLALQMQTFDAKSDGLSQLADSIQDSLDVLKPQSLLLYAGKPGQEFFTDNIDYDQPVRVLDTRISKLAAARSKRTAKDTL